MPTDRQFTGQRRDYYIKLYHMGARMYDPELGRFISPDSIVPDFSNPQLLNRYSYTLGNPLRYTDPSGHIVILATAAAGAVIGGIVGGAAYLITTPQNQWNLGDGLLVAATGALAGGLIGTGVGAAGGATLASSGFMAASTAAIHTGAGLGMGLGGINTLRDNRREGSRFHAGEFVANSVGGAVTGALSAAIPGSGMVPAIARAGVSGVGDTLTYAGAESIQGNALSAKNATNVLAWSTIGAFFGDLAGQTVFGTWNHRNRSPVTFGDLFCDMPDIDMRNIIARDPRLLSKEIQLQGITAAREFSRDYVVSQLFQAR